MDARKIINLLPEVIPDVITKELNSFQSKARSKTIAADIFQTYQRLLAEATRPPGTGPNRVRGLVDFRHPERYFVHMSRRDGPGQLFSDPLEAESFKRCLPKVLFLRALDLVIKKKGLLFEPSFEALREMNLQLDEDLRKLFARKEIDVFGCDHGFLDKTIQKYNSYMSFLVYFASAHHALINKDLTTYSLICSEYFVILKDAFEDVNGFTDKFGVACLHSYLGVFREQSKDVSTFCHKKFLCMIYPLINYIKFILKKGSRNNFYFRACTQILTESNAYFKNNRLILSLLSSIQELILLRRNRLLVVNQFEQILKSILSKAKSLCSRIYKLFALGHQNQSWKSSENSFFDARIIER